jgi:hypothetical protein
MIKAIIKHPGHPPFCCLVKNTLESFQNIVGGYIETVTVGDVVIICNEEGFLLGLPFNCNVDGMRLVGPILLVGQDGDEFADVPAGARDLIEEVSQ